MSDLVSHSLRLRENLIDGQLAPNAVTDAVLLNAMRNVARERFVPELFSGAAYVDEAIPLAKGRVLIEPLVQARMLQALMLHAEASLLIIGGATGYTAAIAVQLCARVVLVEESPELLRAAKTALAEEGATQVVVREQALAQGDPAHAPYDAIMIEGAAQTIPEALFDQLKEGGRLVAVLQTPSGNRVQSGTVQVFEKHAGRVSSRPLFDAGVALLTGFALPARFEFGA